MRKETVLWFLAALLTAVVAPGAYASASDSPQSLSFTLTCGDAVYSVVSPSQDTPTALIVGSTNVSIAAIVEETISFMDSSGQPQTLQQTFVMGPAHGSAAGLQTSETTCTGSPVSFPGEYGPVTVTTVVTQFTTPRGR